MLLQQLHESSNDLLNERAKKEIMEHIAPLGPVYQAGTLSGNPIAMAAGLKTMQLISQPGFYDELSSKVEHLVNGIMTAAKDAGIPMTENHVGGMFGLFFTDIPHVVNIAQTSACNIERFQKFYNGILAEGIYLAPSAYAAGLLSSSHTE